MPNKMPKTALIIGGTRGIGKAIAVHSAQENAVNTLIINYLENDATAKATLESIVRYLAVELASQNIRVNGVISGLIQGKTLPFFPNIEEVIDITLNRTPAKRLGTPEDVVEMVTFILTKAAWLYGQNIILDGGYCLT